eukprot:730366-Amphidinium_carterae.1
MASLHHAAHGARPSERDRVTSETCKDSAHLFDPQCRQLRNGIHTLQLHLILQANQTSLHVLPATSQKARRTSNGVKGLDAAATH